jgi:sulfonate transport system ATP-binding protein
VNAPVLAEAPSFETKSGASGSSVSLRNVKHCFGANQVLRGINVDISPGQFVAVVGRSGCGKSTLLRLLAGLTTPTAGTIAIDGMTTGRRESARLMFQEPRLLPWRRVATNVEVGLTRNTVAGRCEAKALLARVGLAGRGRDWPSLLSGGQKQRVALARALASHPRLLLLDEPLGALDALTRMGMQDLITEVWYDKGFTAIVVTHDVSEAITMADRVLLIEQGRMGLDFKVDLPRPRRRGDPEAAAIEGRLLRRLLHRQ